MSRSERFLGLDVLRGTAILFALGHHLRTFSGCPRYFYWVTSRFTGGIDMFFVLSGWLIGGQLFREFRRAGGIDMRRFWVRRWMRTLPTYYVCLTPVLIYMHPGVLKSLESIFFLQNYLAPWVWTISWSLCVEEHFYLLLPCLILLLVGLYRSSPKAFWVLICLVFAISPVCRWFAFQKVRPGDYWDYLARIYIPTHLRLEGLSFGVGLAALKEWDSPWWRRIDRNAGAVALLGAAVFLISTFEPHLTGFGMTDSERVRFFQAVPGYFLVSLGITLTMPLLASPRFRLPAALSLGWVWLADHAYTLYLCHDAVFSGTRLLLMHHRLPFWATAPAALAVSALLSSLLRRCVEIPGLELRDRLLS